MADPIIRELANQVLEVWGDHISTHYEGCWKRHVACFAAVIVGHLDEEETP